MRLFLDTNILIDVLAQREPFYAPSALIWSLAESGKARGFVSALSFNNVYYLVRHLAGKKRAAEAVRLLHRVLQVVPVNGRIIAQAIESGMDDFEDAIQYYCALHSRSPYLITRNPKDFPAEGLALLSPEEFLSLVADGEGPA